MLPFRIVSTDLDGTLLQDDGSISQENRGAMAALAAEGVFVVPNTGRTLEEIPATVREAAEVRYIIYSDGSVVYDKETGERDAVCMTGALCRTVLAVLRRYPCSMSVRCGGACYVKTEEHNEADYIRYRVNRPYREFLYEYSHPVADFEAFCDGLDEIEMICAFFANDEAENACRRELEATGLLQVASSCPHNIEFFDRHAGKGNALLRLARRLGIDGAATVAVGDSTNDSDMIRRAGLGLAMANAVPALKAEADAVICHYTEHAIDYIKKQYIFQNI